MLPRISIIAAVLVAALSAAISLADDTKVVISVEHPKLVADDSQKSPIDGTRPAVDIAILLDTSNSMDGLINQAKKQLWTIVQQFAKAKKHGQTPVLRVALFEYGNTNLPASEGFIRQVVPLTDNLDKLSESLFELKTCGGDEYCGQVIREAVKRLDWSKAPNAYKAIFIAGNEPFTQGTVDYHESCKQAIDRGIVVNTIHCGTRQEGIIGEWEKGAKLAEGEYLNIDQDRHVVEIECPQDKVIIKLNAELNKTYLWYGGEQERQYYAANQEAQDSNAAQAGGGVASSRASAKASPAYSNRNRDLIDSYAEDKSVLKKVKDGELPEDLRKVPASDRENYVQQMASRRGEIQKQISALSTERDAYLAKERNRVAGKVEGSTFGDAAVAAIGKQLEKSGFDREQDAQSVK
jgi:hypothetical protein